MSFSARLFGSHRSVLDKHTSLRLEQLEPRVLLSAAAYIQDIELWQGINYGAPGDSPTYEFGISFETTTNVTALRFTTAADEPFEIPKLPDQQNGNIETSYDEEGGTGYWELDVESPNAQGLADFGDGPYTISIDRPGGSEQTLVWFGVPGGANFIPQPTQRPIITAPVNNGVVGSPVTFRWDRCTDANSAMVFLEVEDRTGTRWLRPMA